ncbi:MAG: hypothetical protein KF866_08505 [Phycisphaeraceae bacterium]|nr:hypothetical protein [Phycisphaeraceae bacterium]MCW5753918.1 hypothetical protein [Phycisphaeraceae bacterium]
MDAQVKTEFSIYLADRPGELAGVLEAAAAAGVEVWGLVVTESAHRGLVRVLGDPEDALRHVFEAMVETGAGPVVETPVLVVPIGDRPGLIREIAARLGISRINVQYAYCAPAVNGSPSRYVLRVSNAEQARQAIEGIA